MTGEAVDRFTDFALGARYETLPADVRKAAKTFFIDTLAVGIAGSRVESSQQVLSTATHWGAGDTATVLGSGALLPTTSAAFVNSFQIHCQEFDCLHEAAKVHAMAVLGGALLANVQEHGCSGKDVLLAVTLGVDVASNLGLAATSGLRFFRPATAGALGATAALARLEGFNDQQFRDAWGLAYSQLAGTMQAHVEGSVALPIQVAVAARAAITSIQLVRHGISGPHDIMEGPFGYIELFEPGANLPPVLEQLGKTWRVTELSHKPFPTGRAAQGTLGALQAMNQEAILDRDQIDHINAYVPPLVKRLVGRPIQAGMGVNYARLCLQYLVPVFLKTGTLDTTSFSPELLNDPDILEWGKKVQVLDDDNPDPNALCPQRLEIIFKDGSKKELQVPNTLGSPQNPLSQERQRAKFFHCLEAGGIPEAQTKQLLALLNDFEQQENLSEILALSCAVG